MAELSYTRVFDAPRELVFRCMLEPEHLTHFWGPAGTSTPLDGITVDPRPGGVFETVMINDADGGSYTMRAVYAEIVPPERIVWAEPGTGMITTSTFTDLGGTRTGSASTRRTSPARSVPRTRPASRPPWTASPPTSRPACHRSDRRSKPLST